MFWFVWIVNVDPLDLSLGSPVEHLVGLGHDGRGGCEGGVSSILLSTTRLGIQLRLGGLPSWVLLDRLHGNVLLVAPCKLVGGLDLDSEGPRVDGEFGVGVQRHLCGLHSWVLLVSLLVNVVLDGLIVGANLGDFVHDFKLGFFLLRSHFLECITK
jgi:hypothetical protein